MNNYLSENDITYFESKEEEELDLLEKNSTSEVEGQVQQDSDIVKASLDRVREYKRFVSWDPRQKWRKLSISERQYQMQGEGVPCTFEDLSIYDFKEERVVNDNDRLHAALMQEFYTNNGKYENMEKDFNFRDILKFIRDQVHSAESLFEDKVETLKIWHTDEEIEVMREAARRADREKVRQRQSVPIHGTSPRWEETTTDDQFKPREESTITTATVTSDKTEEISTSVASKGLKPPATDLVWNFGDICDTYTAEKEGDKPSKSNDDTFVAFGKKKPQRWGDQASETML